MSFQPKFRVTLRARLKADGLRTKGARSPRGPLPESGTNLWLAVHRHPLEGATRISLDLDISAIFQDIVAIFSPYDRSPWRLQIPQSNLWLALPVWGSAAQNRRKFQNDFEVVSTRTNFPEIMGVFRILPPHMISPPFLNFGPQNFADL